MIIRALLMAAASIIVLAASAFAEMGGHGMRQGMGQGMACGCNMDGQQMMGSEHHMSKHLMSLNLDDQQKAFMNEIKTRMKKETIRRTADMRIVQIELKDLLLQDTVDMKAVEAKVKQMETMKADMHLSHIRAMEECKAKLTPAQRKTLKDMIEAEPKMDAVKKKHDRRHQMKKK